MAFAPNTTPEGYVVDPRMYKLIRLTTAPEGEKNVDEILKLIHEEAPSLLTGLAASNTRAIARAVQVKCYKNDEVVFHQNDWPDAHYTILRGAISIYALLSSAQHSEEEVRRSKSQSEELRRRVSGTLTASDNTCVR